MTRINIILTVDYEIFGNGTGDVRWCLIEPTNKMLEIATKFSAPITLMAELCEYWAFRREEQKRTLPAGYKPASWIEEQLIKCMKDNHDVQLHIHPQWINSSYDSRARKWNIDYEHQNLSMLSYKEIYNLLTRGKQELEGLLRPYRPEYECCAFRAGGWSFQPEEHVLKALIDAGFKIETSVAPEIRSENKGAYFDFTGVPCKPYWFVEENVKQETEKGILELPIRTQKYLLWDRVYYKFLRKIKRVNMQPEKCTGTIENYSKKSLVQKLLPVFPAAYNMFDFCAMSDSEMMNLLEFAKKKFRNFDSIPIVAIGHSKNFNSMKNLESFIKKSLEKGFIFLKLSDILKGENEVLTQKKVSTTI